MGGTRGKVGDADRKRHAPCRVERGDRRRETAGSAAEKSAAPKLEFDLTFRSFTDLYAQRRRDSRRFGAKSAQPGEISAISGVRVPPGFSIPFAYYRDHFEASVARALVLQGLETGRALHDAARRKEALEKIRAAIQAGAVANMPAAAIKKAYDERFAGKAT